MFMKKANRLAIYAYLFKGEAPRDRAERGLLLPPPRRPASWAAEGAKGRVRVVGV